MARTVAQENDSKTARAEKKAAEEIKLRELKEREIEELQKQVRPATFLGPY